jgi:catechol 2,3-dioxygenase-like lactoylglutathione lyase family enzyme
MNSRKQATFRRLDRVAFRGMAVVGVLLALLAALCGSMAMGRGTSAAPPSSASDAPQAAVQSVVRIGMTVGDLDRSIEFYTGVLGFTKVSEAESAGEYLEHLTGVFGARVRTARLRVGNEQIELTQYLAPEGRPIPVESHSNDRWFQHVAIAVSDMDRAYAHLRAHKVRHVSTGPQTLPQYLPNAAGISAFYFKDPDGHVLEVIHFPPGKGDPRWVTPQASDAIFLGIDHTAIAVADTEASLRFYRDTLGLRVVGGSENYGMEQEHLNNVFGAHLRITTLRATSGPGVELLEYLAPSNGRPYPTDSHANDLWHWQATVATASVETLAHGLRDIHARWISAGVVVESQQGASLMVRDPDGHAVIISGSTK